MKSGDPLPDAASNCDNRPALRQPAFWAGFALIAIVFGLGAALTWRKWPDLIVDFGLQLYIPWHLSQGAVLYRDLFYMAGGPLSQYWHALLFKLFGPSFLVIIISNFAAATLILSVIYYEFWRARGLLCGLATTIPVVCIFCFGEFTGVGNYNYAAPYSHEMLHGLALSLAALAALSAWREHKTVLPMAVAGLCAGLAALTKPDIFLALQVSILAAFALSLKLDRTFLIRSVYVFLAGMIVPLLTFFLFFLRIGDWRESLRLEFFGWRPLFIDGVVNSPFYQWCLGMDDPIGHVHIIALHTLVVVATVTACAWAVRMFEGFAPLSRRLLYGVILLLLLAAAAYRVNWADAGAVLPAACLLLLVLLLRQFRKDSPNRAYFFSVVWTLFALLFLAKQGLFPRLWQTGFTLAMPAFVGTIFLFGWALPEFLKERYRVPARPMRCFALGVLLIAIARLVHTSLQFYEAKRMPVGQGLDTILATGPNGNAVEARVMNQTLAWIATNTPPTSSLAAIPEGVMINYLSRRTNSTTCIDWNPVMMAVFGADNMDASLMAHPPDYIALVEWRPYEFNAVDFGSTNYGGNVMAWIHDNYTPEVLFGSEPLRNGLFGIKLLRHSASPATSAGKKPVL